MLIEVGLLKYIKNIKIQKIQKNTKKTKKTILQKKIKSAILQKKIKILRNIIFIKNISIQKNENIKIL
jgi:hypothetical protein